MVQGGIEQVYAGIHRRPDPQLPVRLGIKACHGPVEASEFLQMRGAFHSFPQELKPASWRAALPVQPTHMHQLRADSVRYMERPGGRPVHFGGIDQVNATFCRGIHIQGVV
jgi:hypothetical protein